jgi:hypothetical protein
MCHLQLLFTLTAPQILSPLLVFPKTWQRHIQLSVSPWVKHFSSFRAVFGASSQEVNEEIPGWEVMGLTELRFLETTAHWGTVIYDCVDGCQGGCHICFFHL